MKKIIYILAASLLLMSCYNKNKMPYSKEVIEHEGCEYIIVWNFTSVKGVAHKGSCNNPVHNCN